jgi:hypothetical protein
MEVNLSSLTESMNSSIEIKKKETFYLITQFIVSLYIYTEMRTSVRGRNRIDMREGQIYIYFIKNNL